MKHKPHIQNVLCLFLIYSLLSISSVGIHSQEDLHEFLREAEIMQSFNHENVVKLLGKI